MLNRSLVRGGRPYAPVTLAEFEILPGVATALQRTREAGFLNIVVTNQPDIATGKQSAHIVQEMHAKLSASLAIDSIRLCAHADTDRCACRKPKPGMLHAAAGDMRIDLARSFLVGDRWRDVAAGQSAGCKCFFIDYGYAEKRPEMPYVLVKSLGEATQLLLAGER